MIFFSDFEPLIPLAQLDYFPNDRPVNLFEVNWFFEIASNFSAQTYVTSFKNHKL